MKRPQYENQCDSNAPGSGFWQRIRERWFNGFQFPAIGFTSGAQNRDDQRIKVWDNRRGCYRYVDLNDRADPLWSSAYAVATLQRENNTRRTAA